MNCKLRQQAGVQSGTAAHLVPDVVSVVQVEEVGIGGGRRAGRLAKQRADVGHCRRCWGQATGGLLH